ncbi:NSFL1 cofactor p47, partial [Stegodyphus mimosarum]
MADIDPAALISEFCKVTGTDISQARRFLEDAGWDSDLAMSRYFEETEDKSGDDDPAFQRPGSPKPQMPPSNSSRIATFASLMGNQATDEEEGQAFYAGGSERSGQQVLGPGKRKAGNEIVEEVFKAVRSFGAEVVDSSEKRHGSTKLKAFRGTGYVLGSSSESSSVVTDPVGDDVESQNVEIFLRLWRTGFTINDGPLRDYHDPENKEFLDSIRKGEIPLELRHKGKGEEVHLNIEDHSHEEYVLKKPTVRAFSGTGFRLGSITPPVKQSESSASSEKDVEEAQQSLNIDESQPVTSVQIRLADGSRLTMKANYTHTVGDVRRFLVLARPEYSASLFSLMT